MNIPYSVEILNSLTTYYYRKNGNILEIYGSTSIDENWFNLYLENNILQLMPTQYRDLSNSVKIKHVAYKSKKMFNENTNSYMLFLKIEEWTPKIYCNC